MSAIIQSFLLSRLPIVFYAIAWPGAKLVQFAVCVLSLFKTEARSRTKLMIEAGERGWESIEFQEILQSGKEYLDDERVVRFVVDKSQSYLSQVHQKIKDERPTHYLYDPRTGDQTYLGSFVEVMYLAVLFARYQVVPIVLLTDLSFRVWRCKSAAVSCVSGTVVTFMSPKAVQPIFPHKRLAGPSLMPFSKKRLSDLINSRERLEASGEIDNVVRFTGSLYEPRTSFLNELAERHKDKKMKVEILGRELGSKRVSDDEYWRRLSSSSIVITTAVQAAQPGIDWEWIPHLVYRYLEVLASGSVLLAPAVPEVERYFVPGEHFVSFQTLEEASDQISFYSKNPKKLEVIRQAGHSKACDLINAHSFWVQIDTALGYRSLTE